MANWPSGLVAVNGIQLHHHRTGGEKPPILFLHGLTDNGLAWSGLVQGLEAEFDCILLDGVDMAYRMRLLMAMIWGN
jgi:N-formylmaleamate deformylase